MLRTSDCPCTTFWVHSVKGHKLLELFSVTFNVFNFRLWTAFESVLSWPILETRYVKSILYDPAIIFGVNKHSPGLKRGKCILYE